ncbi:MAG: serine protease [Bacteroidota bacterium]
METNSLVDVAINEFDETDDMTGNGATEDLLMEGSMGADAERLSELGLESVAQFSLDNLDESGVNLGLQDVSSEESNALNEMSLEEFDTLEDAYLASFDRNSAETDRSVSEVIIGADNRIRIHSTHRYPWRAVCSLLIKAKTGKYYIGTGWFIGPGTVMTAGHCVYLHNEGGWAESVTVMPGRNGSNMPYGSIRATHLRSNTSWTNNRSADHDYGCIILPRNQRVGNRTGWFGFAYMGDSALKKKYLNLPGYPGDKPSGTMWYHHQGVKRLTSRRIYYTIDTMGGQSGSPVYYIKDGKRYAVGIHAYGHSSGNSAPRITKGVFNLMKSWKQRGQ